MATILEEILMHAVAPAGVFVIVALLTVHRGPARTGRIAVAAWAAVCFAYGQIRITGAFVWPWAETSHALVGLVFAEVIVAVFERRWGVAFSVLNVGAYFALYPLFDSGERALGQWFVANGALALLMVAGRSATAWASGVAQLVGFGGLSIVFIAGASTSLAMTSALLAGIGIGRALVRWRARWPCDAGAVAPAFFVLLVLELYNYVW